MASQVFLYINTINNLASATEINASADLAPNGGVYGFNIGAPNATRYFWAKLIDASGNESIHPLGSYTTQDNTNPVISSATMALTTSAEATSVDLAWTTWDNDEVQTVYVLFNSSQTTDPGAALIKSAGDAYAGTSTGHTYPNLDPATTYYGWILVRDRGGNESYQQFTPASITTDADTTAPTLDSYSLTATLGAEESSVDITITISDVVG